MPKKSPLNIDEILNRPFLYFFIRYKWLTATSLVAIIFTNILDVLIPLLLGQAIDLVANEKGMDLISKKVALIFIVALALTITRYFWRKLWGTFHNSVANDMRKVIFAHLTSLGPSFFQKRPVGELMSLLISDVMAFKIAVGPGTLVLFDGIIYLLIIPPMMVAISLDWTLKTLVLMPLIPFVVSKLTKIIHKKFADQQKKFSEVSGFAQELANGIRVIKSYAQEHLQIHLFNQVSKKYEHACNQTMKADALFAPTMMLGLSVGAIILIFIGAPAVVSGTATIGSFFAFYQYIQKMIWPVTALGHGASMRSRGRASFQRILEILETKVDTPDLGTYEMIDFENLEVRNLTFTYPGASAPSLQNISFRIQSGETIGVVGSTGAGKTTLVELLARLYPTDSETILYNGRTIEELRIENLRSHVSIVPQESFLFSSSVENNLKLNKQRSPADIETATKTACFHDEILKMDNGYNSQLGERGINLSGGQKQRLSIARGLIQKSSLVIFDDSLSAVDAKTQKRILYDLKKNIQSPNGLLKTTIIVSHRLSAVQWADKILVLNNGKVEGFAKHEELLKSSETYQNLYLLQKEGAEA